MADQDWRIYAKYVEATGEILSIVSVPELGAQAQCEPGEAVIEADIDTDTLAKMVSGGVIVDRPANPTVVDKTTIVADGVDVAAFTSIPVGADILIEGPVGHHEVSDGTMDLSSEVAGTYTVEIFGFPHLTAVIEIVASEPS